MHLLFPLDTHYGHIVVETPEGAVYQDDQTLVDDQNPRPCKGCGANMAGRGHDPCIANLPDTAHACCGHGLNLTLRGGLPGYVALNSGRTFRFSGCLLGKGVREAVEAARQGLLLPEGFEFDVERMWWEGLTTEQRSWVIQQVPQCLAELVTELKGGEPPSDLFLRGEAMWYEELSAQQRELGLSRMRGILDGLVQRVLVELPARLETSLLSLQISQHPDAWPDEAEATTPERSDGAQSLNANDNEPLT